MSKTPALRFDHPGRREARPQGPGRQRRGHAFQGEEEHEIFRKILTAYAGKAGINPDTIRMMVDGQRVNLEQCPGDYDMESGDQIDAMAEQQGGLGQDPAAAAVAAALRDNLARQAEIEAALERLRSVMAATLREREAIKRQLIARGAAPLPTTAPPPAYQ